MRPTGCRTSTSRARGRSARSPASSTRSTSSRTASPDQAAYRDYRRWAFESAALDLALQQAGRSLGEALGRPPQPLTFVSSTRAASLDGWLALYPALRFKLDPTPEWTDELVAELAARGDVDVVDLKGAYHGTAVDNPPDPVLYRRVAEGFPEAWIEDPALNAGDRRRARAAPRPDHLGRADPLLGRRRGAAVRAALPQLQAVALRLGRAPVRVLRPLRRARDRPLRRRAVRARRRPRPDPAARRAVPSGRPERRRARRLQRARAACRACPSARSIRARRRPASSAPSSGVSWAPMRGLLAVVVSVPPRPPRR